MEKTNDLLEKVAGDLRKLIDWANADRDASLEAAAKAQAEDDRRRAHNLERALQLIQAARK